MNLPNKITISRLFIGPLVLVFFFLPDYFGENLRLFSIVMVLILYCLNEVTDVLDGKIARKRNLVTDLGKVMDPFCDVFSRLTYFVCLTFAGVMPVIAFALIVWREFSMMFVRMLMMGKGKAVAANIFGKSKSFLYALGGIFGFLYYGFERLNPEYPHMGLFKIPVIVLLSLASVASVTSFLIYLSEIKKDGALSTLTR